MSERRSFAAEATAAHRPLAYLAGVVLALAGAGAVALESEARRHPHDPSAERQTREMTHERDLARTALLLARGRSLDEALTTLPSGSAWVEAARTDRRGTLLGARQRPAPRGLGCTRVRVDDAGAEQLVMTFATRCEEAPPAQRPWPTVVLGLLGALGAVGAVLAAGHQTRRKLLDTSARLRLVEDGLARVAAGEAAVAIRPRGDDEVARLIEGFNRMVDELSLVRGRVDTLQRIAGWQDFARRLAHEIKNPLTPIQLAAQELARKYSGDDKAFARTLATATEVIEEEVATLRRLVSAFSEFARLPEVKTASADLAEFVRDMASSRAFLEEAGGGSSAVAVHFDAGEGTVPVKVDRILLRRAVENLVRNAVQALEGAKRGGAVWVKVEAAPDAEAVWLVVEDDGPGISKADQARVFDPYFTTKAEGTGLGLAIVRKVALDHDGDVGVEDRPGGGARFVVTLPRVDAGRKAQRSFVTFSPRGHSVSK